MSTLKITFHCPRGVKALSSTLGGVRDFSASSSQAENINSSLGSQHPVWDGVRLGAQLSPGLVGSCWPQKPLRSSSHMEILIKKVVLT